jgi:hypothetical protein
MTTAHNEQQYGRARGIGHSEARAPCDRENENERTYV